MNGLLPTIIQEREATGTFPWPDCGCGLQISLSPHDWLQGAAWRRPHRCDHREETGSEGDSDLPRTTLLIEMAVDLDFLPQDSQDRAGGGRRTSRGDRGPVWPSG